MTSTETPMPPDAWTTSQCVTALLLNHRDPSSIRDHLQAALDYIYNRRVDVNGDFGWKTFPDFPHTRTEIGAWAAIAYVNGLRSGKVWPPDKLEVPKARLKRILDDTVARQCKDGGWAPVRTHPCAEGSERTYSTVMAVWSLAEARIGVSDVARAILDEPISLGVQWLASKHNDYGWTPNPNTEENRQYTGLTGQALFALQSAKSVPGASTYIESESCLRVKRAFVEALAKPGLQFCSRDSVPYPDRQIEGETFDVNFIAFPWALGALSELANDTGLDSAHRRSAAASRDKLIHQLRDVAQYYEAAQTFELAEHLIALSFAPGKGDRFAQTN